MDFGRGFAVPVFCPVNAIGNQLDYCGVNRMDPALEAVQRCTVALAKTKLRVLGGKSFVKLPVQFLNELVVPVFVGMGQGVLAGWMDGKPIEDTRL